MDQARLVDQPFSIDRLPPFVQIAIRELYTRHGLTWQEIEDLSALPFGQPWPEGTLTDEGDAEPTATAPSLSVDPKCGFVPWDKLPARTLELFPDMRIPRSNLHRWFRARVAQVRQQLLESSERAREIAQAFAAATVDGSNEAVLNAARDQLMIVLSEDSSTRGRMGAAKALIVLAEVMQGARANDIKERKVSVDERKMAQLEKDAELRRRKMAEESEKLKRKAKKGYVTPEDIDRLRERVFGLPPKAKVEADAQEE